MCRNVRRLHNMFGSIAAFTWAGNRPSGLSRATDRVIHNALRKLWPVRKGRLVINDQL